MAEVDGRVHNGGCFDPFPAQGVLTAYTTGAIASQVYGLVADDVTKVVLIDDKGAATEQHLENGAFWWTGGIDQTVKALDVTRAGHVFRYQFPVEQDAKSVIEV